MFEIKKNIKKKELNPTSKEAKKLIDTVLKMEIGDCFEIDPCDNDKRSYYQNKFNTIKNRIGRPELSECYLHTEKVGKGFRFFLELKIKPVYEV